MAVTLVRDDIHTGNYNWFIEQFAGVYDYEMLITAAENYANRKDDEFHSFLDN